MKYHRWFIVMFAVVLVMALAACSGGPSAGEGGEEPYPPPEEELDITPLPTLDEAYPPPAEEQPAATQPAGSSAAAQPTAAPQQPAVTDFPDPAGYEWKQVAFGLDTPIGMTNAGDGSGRLFVNEKAGQIRIMSGGQLLDQPFLDIRDRVGSSQSEQGLLGLAFPPNYNQSGFFFVNYTEKNGNTVISRFRVTDDPNRADPGSERILITQQQPYPNHNGGGMAFGPDGYLYLSLGDGGSAGDPQGNGQNLDTLLGKLLRIDVVSDDPYAIPVDNPFQGGKEKHEIWAYGLRNAWRFSFDQQTGDLWIADVGQNQWEEINFQPAAAQGGLNYGWDYKEATHPYEGTPPDGVELIDPVFEYDHSQGCSVTGGYVYRGQTLPEWQGVYFFGDYCSGNVWGLLRKGDSFEGRLLFPLKNIAIPAFGQDEAGEVYMVLMNGIIMRLEKK